MDDVDDLVNPVPRKSRKTRGARSIRSIQDENPVRAKALEAGYEYIRRKVWTDEEATWTERREAVALLAQDALDFGFTKLGLDPSDFAPVTDKEQDLVSLTVSFTHFIFTLHRCVNASTAVAR